MMIAILIVLLLICAFGWFKWYVGATAFVMCTLKKGYTPPSEAEMKACAVEVAMSMLKLKSKK